MRGTLHLVVGPSGVGKDMLIDAARAARPDILFPVRDITRPAESGGEAHNAVTQEAFEARASAGGYALHWRAHGLGYGVPATVASALETGRHVLVNVSRTVLGEARARFAPLRVLAITAPAEVLARRLAVRGREDAADIAARLARADAMVPEGPEVIRIDNGGSPEAGIAAFLAALAPAA